MRRRKREIACTLHYLSQGQSKFVRISVLSWSPITILNVFLNEEEIEAIDRRMTKWIDYWGRWIPMMNRLHLYDTFNSYLREEIAVILTCLCLVCLCALVCSIVYSILRDLSFLWFFEYSSLVPLCLARIAGSFHHLITCTPNELGISLIAKIFLIRFDQLLEHSIISSLFTFHYLRYLNKWLFLYDVKIKCYEYSLNFKRFWLRSSQRWGRWSETDSGEPSELSGLSSLLLLNLSLQRTISSKHPLRTWSMDAPQEESP